ncbi:unnamed protein product [Rotaria sordida]|uniref:HAT C-terminal dimerisation domain-containing protein n=1 Tax=Rotaria sordida TaxID=392033 RepID=A0A815VQL8_9BILA|nr:unnamed protein product [Rotaria sordida]
MFARNRDTASSSQLKEKLGHQLTLMCCKDLLPFSIVENEGFLDFLISNKIVNAKYDIPSRTTLSPLNLNKIYNVCLDKTKEQIKLSTNYPTITCDAWTDNLRTQPFNEAHTDESIKDLVSNVLIEFGINPNSVSDKDANMRKAWRLLNVIHIFCVDHGIHNLLMKDCFHNMNYVSEILDKIQSIINKLHYHQHELENEYFRSNEKRFNDLLLSIDKTDEIIDADLASTYIDADDTQVLNKKFQNDNLEALRLSDDLKFRFHTLKKRIVTCWNTVLIMLRSYADNILGIEVILGRLKHFDLILTAAENEIVRDLIQFLSLFESTTTILSASKSYPTISLCLLLRIIDISRYLTQCHTTKELILSEMIKQFKINHFTQAFATNNASISSPSQSCSSITTTATSHSNPSTTASSTSMKCNLSVESLNSPVKHLKKLKENLIQKHKPPSTSGFDPILDEIQNYLQLDISYDDVLQFWRSSGNAFPHLKRLAQIVLAVPATSTPSEQVFSTTGVQRLCKALEQNKTLKTLDLSHNQTGDEGAQHLGKVLEQNKTLTTLNLRSNKISHEGARHLSKGLEQNRTLTTLDLSYNHIGHQGIQHLSKALEQNQTVTTLTLYQAEIGDEGAQHLGKALEQNKQTLNTMDLSHNQIGDEGAQHLGKALEKNQTLTTLDLSRNQIDDEGVQHIGKALEQNQALTTLDLNCNQIGTQGAQYLGKALERNQTLITLNLNDNEIDVQGAQHLAKALEQNQTLITLNLFDNQLSRQGAERLANARQQNRIQFVFLDDDMDDF